MRAICLGATFALLACGSPNASSEDGGQQHVSSGGSANGGTAAGGTSGATAGGSSATTGGSASGAAAGALSNGGSSGGTSAGSGGAANGGSSGLPHTVSPCDGLSEAGTWEEVTPPYITEHPSFTGALVVLVNPQDPATVFLSSDSDGVFKTDDCGATWTKTNTGAHGGDIDSGRIWSAVLDPVDPNTLYLLTGYGAAGLWKSTNAGVDWAQTLPSDGDIGSVGAFTERVAMDPTDHLHLLVNFHQNCGGGHTPVCFGETTDGGGTWSVVDNVPGDGWAEGSGMFMLSADVWIYGAAFGPFSRTSDHGQTWNDVAAPGAGGANFPGDSRAFQTADGNYYVGSLQGVITSPDGATWSLLPNSGGKLTPVIGDGQHLYAGEQWPDNGTMVFTASYDDDATWSQMPTTGMPADFSGGIYTFDYDPDHHLLYTTMQSGGLWRVVTE